MGRDIFVREELNNGGYEGDFWRIQKLFLQEILKS